VKPIITPILSGVLLAYLFFPFYKMLLNKVLRSQANWAKTVAALSTVLVIILVILGPAVTLALGLLSQYKRISKILLETVPQTIDFFSQKMPTFVSDLNQTLGINLDVSKMFTGFTNQALNILQDVLKQVPSFILGSFITLFIVYYLLKNSKAAFAWLQHFLPLSEARYKIISKRFKDLGRGMITSQFAIAIVQGVLACVIFLVLGIKHFVLLGLLTTLLALIPFVGAVAVWFTAFLVLAFQIPQGGPIWKPVLLFFYGTFLISIVDNILRPKMMSHSAEMHPAIIMIGLIGGLVLFGVPGILIGPLVLGLMDIALEVYQETF
jgi:predicted PurR-regulated permease PerM